MLIISNKPFNKADPNFNDNINRINQKYMEHYIKLPKIIYIEIDNTCINFENINLGCVNVLVIKGFSYELFEMLLNKGYIDPVEKLEKSCLTLF